MNSSTCEHEEYNYCTLLTMLSLSRIEFVPCNKHDLYVIEVHIKPGEKNEIYSDSDNKVRTPVHTHTNTVSLYIIYCCNYSPEELILSNHNFFNTSLSFYWCLRSTVEVAGPLGY